MDKGKWKKCWKKRGFIHKYVGEGMEEGEFNEAINYLRDLKAQYEELNKNSTEGEVDENEE